MLGVQVSATQEDEPPLNMHATAELRSYAGLLVGASLNQHVLLWEVADGSQTHWQEQCGISPLRAYRGRRIRP